MALAAFALGACEGRQDPSARASAGEDPTAALPIEVVDDAGRTVRVPGPVGRIVSLVPSVTETILALGARDRLVARTRYDEAPELAALPSIGGGLDPSIEAIVALDPDLVVTWDTGEGRLPARLEDSGVSVYVAAIQDTAAIYATIRRFGDLLDRAGVADSVRGALRDTLSAIAAESGGSPRPSVFYWMAGDPPRTAGRGTFISQAIEIAGGRAAFHDLNALWPAVSLESVVARDPDVVVVPVGDDLPDAEALAGIPGWRELTAVRTGRVVEIPADLFARPGPRLGRATRVLRDGLVDVLRDSVGESTP